MPGSGTCVSVIVPTYCEAENLPQLAERVDRACRSAGMMYELIVVDDASPDATCEVCAALSYDYPLRLIVRRGQRGLSSAVMHGCDAALGDWIVVMDADLSHPPERIPALIEPLVAGQADFVVGSRYTLGGSTSAEWSAARRWNSRIATLLARPLTSVSDPMAGFFALSKRIYDSARPRLNPIGYKIALELIVKASPLSVLEVPIHFEDRQLGQSKLSPRQQLLYLQHLLRLYCYRFERQGALPFVRFVGVGACGAVVDLATYGLLLAAGLTAGAARAVAVGVAMSANYVGHQRFTFLPAQPLSLRRFTRFCASCSAGAVVNWLVSMIVASIGGAAALWLGALVGIVAGAMINYWLCRSWVFVRAAQECGASAGRGSVALAATAEPASADRAAA